LTSVGLTTGTIWVHDKSGERQMPFEGSAWFPLEQANSRAIFSPDGKKLYFLGKQNAQDTEDLWAADLTSGLMERPVPGIFAQSFDVSADGKQIVFDSPDAHGELHLWIASLDRRSSPRRLASDSPESHPLFGPEDDLFFQAQENGRSYLYRRSQEGGQRKKVVPDPVTFLQTISADGKWVVVEMPVSREELTRAVVAYRLPDGSAKRLCQGLCIVRWSLDGKSLYIGLPGGSGHSGAFQTFVIPLRHGESFPELPDPGIKAEKDLTILGGVKVINELARPGPNASLYASSRLVTHRNIYRIPIP
jgi:dipeptidyl aminopeptidase/acylaminoacyl peptidase